MEHKEERRAEAERLQNWSLEKLVRSGFTLTNLSGAKNVARHFSRDVVRFESKSLAQNETFATGDEAILSRHGPVDGSGALRDDVLRVEVCEVSTTAISVAIAHSDGGIESVSSAARGAAWRLDRISPSVAHERTLRVLTDWSTPSSRRSACASPALRRLLVRSHEPDTARRLTLHNGEAATAGSGASRHDAVDRPSTGKETAPSASESALLQATAAAVDEEYATPEMQRWPLNVPQRSAIVRALVDGSGAHPHRPKVTLIQGPPGTGKTSTACALLRVATLGTESPLLAAADSNAAVDQLLEGLLRRGVRALRLGRPSRADPLLWQATVEARLETHPEHAEMTQHRTALLQLRRHAAALEEGPERTDARARLKDGWRRLRAWESRLSAELVETAEVVCSTLVGCGGPELAGRRFPLVVVDECTQATEPRSLLALALAQSAVVLLGDQKQLAPTCSSQAAAQAGLATSLFDRLLALRRTGGAAAEHSRVQHCLLTVQYRMHPLLREWPSAQFYGGQLVDGVGAEARPLPPTFPSSEPLLFLDHTAGETAGGGGTSKYNRAEAKLVAASAAMLLRTPPGAGAGAAPTRQFAELHAADVGIITPYAAQAVEIRRSLRLLGVNGVEVKTVDGFQGREKDVIVVSCVRSNRSRRIGFLDDSRRLNVALTRARRGLVVVGCRQTLSADPVWSSFLTFCEERGLMRRGSWPHPTLLSHSHTTANRPG